MSITKIEIENYKSIKRCTLSVNDINLLIGENGSGKTNVLSAITYFYDNLIETNDGEYIFDANNKFNNCVKISITYDFTKLKVISYKQLKNEDTQYESFYKKILRIASNDILTVTLTKIKDKKINWNCSLNDRKVIYNLFPLYIIDTRNIELLDWSKLWDKIGDLTKIENNREQELNYEFKRLVSNERYKLEGTFRNLTKAFSKANIRLKQFTPKQFASSLSKTYLYGDEFEFKDSKLAFHSNGTNSFNYTSILIEILKLIANSKMKCPIVLLDEPEISLHHKLIDELTQKLFDCCTLVSFIISTHSPRLLKNVLINDTDNSNIYHITLKDSYSVITKMKLFDTKGDLRPKVFITDQHSNAYFARIILSVEGESELELFGNKYLQTIFPVLKDVDIVTGMSDNVIANIISPSQRKYKTPILSLIDMDKIICKHPVDNKFSIVKDYFTNTKSEKYYYTERRKKTLLTRRLMLVYKCGHKKLNSLQYY